MNKGHLDRILEKHKAQPVGSGYVDIIVWRDNYQNLVQALVENGFEIESISWWEWCEKENECKYGLGGPKSEYYDGWFAELATEVDDLKLSDKEPQETIQKILNFIESKTIGFSDEKVWFQKSKWLTPAIWLNVPDDWKNKKSAYII